MLTQDLLNEGLEKGLIEKTNANKKIYIAGKDEILPIYKIRLNALYYNDKNDRISTWISKYQSDNNAPLNIKDIDNYNNIIQSFIEQSNPAALNKTKTNINIIGQQEPGVVLNDGRIVDGNRRFTCLRILNKENINKYNYFEAIILPEKLSRNEKDIKLLELAIQHGKDSIVDYNPIDRLVGIYNDIIENKLITIEEYAQTTNETEKEIYKKIELAKLMIEYLEFIGAPKQFFIARETDIDGPLHEIYNALKKCNDDKKKSIHKKVMFQMLLLKPDGDMTRYIRSIKNDVINSDSEETYLNEQTEMLADVTEKLIDLEDNKSDHSNIIAAIRSDSQLTEKVNRSKEKAVDKSKREQIKNKPLELVNKSIEALDAIDINVIKKLNSHQIEEIQNQLFSLEDKIQEIRDFIGE